MVPSRRRGMAVVSALLILMLMTGMVLAFLATVMDSGRATHHRTEELEVEKAAESSIRMAIHEIWGSFEFAQEDQRTTPADFMAYLDSIGIPASPVGVDNPTDVLDEIALPALAGRSTFGSVVLESLEVVRHDSLDGTLLTFTASAREGDAQVASSVQRDGLSRSISEVWVVERTKFEGLEYAMLSNNLNCAFCHLDVDTAARVYNDDAAMYGSFERVRVGSLDTFQLRHGTEDSRIAGTLYLAGQAVYSDATAISNWGSIDLRSRRFGSDGLLEESGLGTLIDDPLTPADADFPAPLENLYLEYGGPLEELVDGFLPSEFPAVFPDDGGYDPITGAAGSGGSGNRIVDSDEFAAATYDVNGSLSGGSIEIIASGGSIDTAAEVSAALNTGSVTHLAPTTAGSVVMIGTASDPILLNGDIAIDGDLVLSGVIKGTGVIQVRGNIYLPSDLEYDDVNLGQFDRVFGQAADGTQNALALAAGGNILVGDIFHPRWGSGQVDSTDSSSFSYVWDEIAAFNKLEWIKAQEFLPGISDDNRDPATFSVPNPRYKGPDYTPRYYTFDSSSPVPILAGTGYYDPSTDLWRGPELAGSWSSWSLLIADPTNSTDPFFFHADGTQKAALSTLLASDGWISEAMLESLIRDLLSRRDADETMRIDAALYTNNSIFGLVSPRIPGTRAGKLRIQGSVVAGDIGLLAPEGLEICYDPRAAELLDIVYDSQLSIRHILSSRDSN